MLDVERLRRIELLAHQLIDVGLTGRWGWFGTPEAPYLSTIGGGRQFVLGTEVWHSHHLVLRDGTDGGTTNRMTCPGGGCRKVRDHDETPVGVREVDDPNSEHGDTVLADEYLARHALLQFLSRNGSRMVTSEEIPIYAVARDAVSRDDPRVYRDDVVGFRSPVAQWLAELDAETVLDLVTLALVGSMDGVCAERGPGEESHER
jgi:hypothetical protein